MRLESLDIFFKNRSRSELALLLIALGCFLYSLYIAVRYANQVPLDLYAFRQTQTALTSFWFTREGFKLAYETPVAGPPWSIPFEFPLYQFIVAWIAKVSEIALTSAGRLTSYLFLALCIIPARAANRSLGLPRQTTYLFAALLFSSPLYLYWGRTFMIETAALFFAVAGVKYFVDIVQGRKSCKAQFLFILFMSLSILQKATTGLPVLGVLSLVYLIHGLIETPSIRSSIFGKKLLNAFFCFGFPLAVGFVWTVYTDQVKMLNDFGAQLTSAALTQWNWGTLAQRLSFQLYADVLWKRVFERNLAGMLGMAILAVAMVSNAPRPVKFTILVSTVLGLIPSFLFTNLHIIHDYYQTASVLFLIYGLAVSLGAVFSSYVPGKILVMVILLILASNYACFARDYMGTVKTVFNSANTRDCSVAEVLKREVPEGKCFVAFGNDWSSSIAFLAERKSFTVPTFYRQYEKVLHHPESFFEHDGLGAVVMCGADSSQMLGGLILWSAGRGWKVGEVHGAYVACPEVPPLEKKAAGCTECQGGIDGMVRKQVGKSSFLCISGWTAISGERGIVPGRIYISLTRDGGDPVYVEALRISRPDVDDAFRRADLRNAGFSRILSADSLSGKYILGIARENNGHLESCQFQKEIVINGQGSDER